MALEHEIQVYRANLADILGVNDVHEGEYVVIKGDDIRGPFPSYEDALTAGYEAFGPVSFLVKKVERVETPVFFAQHVR
jgi:hypothetical protein